MEPEPSAFIDSNIHSVVASGSEHDALSSERSFIVISDTPQNSLNFDIGQLQIIRLHSNNEQKVMHLIKKAPKQQQKHEEKNICIQEICLEHSRLSIHQNHKSISLQKLLKQAQVLKGNYHFNLQDPHKVIGLLDCADDIEMEIFKMQRDVLELISRIKIKARQHLQKFKQSFGLQLYRQASKRISQQFNYANVRLLLSRIQEFKTFVYPSLEYPAFKLSSMLLRINKASSDFKGNIMRQLSNWSDHLQARQKFNEKVMINRSVTSFLQKTTCEENIFSYYLKSKQYEVVNGKLLRRVQDKNQNIPFVVIEKQLKNGVQIKFKIKQIGKGMIIGCCPLKILEKRQFQNVIGQKASYFLSHRGYLMPIGESKFGIQQAKLSFTSNDELIFKRDKNILIFRRKKGSDNTQQEIKINLKIEDFDQKLYSCIHLQDTSGLLQLI